jgi:RNA polymerase sigma-70 factor, ECF subfamily
MHIVHSSLLEQWNVLTDEQVVARVRAGQTALFEVLMRRHAERLYRTARAIVGDDQDAEDVVLHAFLNAYARLGQFNDTNRFATWLTRIAILDSLARIRAHDRYPGEEHSVAAAPERPQ